MQVLEVLISSNVFSFLDFASRNLAFWVRLREHTDNHLENELAKVDCTIPAPSENMSSIQM